MRSANLAELTAPNERRSRRRLVGSGCSPGREPTIQSCAKWHWPRTWTWSTAHACMHWLPWPEATRLSPCAMPNTLTTSGAQSPQSAMPTGNQATVHDPSWLPLGDTPMHPEYPCAHCITSAAAGVVLQRLFGEEIPEVSMTSATAPGVTRKWTRIPDYVEEVSAARIYAGFHYRFSTAVGQDMGRKIAELTLATQLRGPEAVANPSR